MSMTIRWVDGFVGGVAAPTEKLGATVEKTVSHLPKVRTSLQSHARAGGNRARALLDVAQARHPGSSTWIEVKEHAQLDWSVHLYSQRGVVAATSIEYGHVGSGAEGAIAPFQVQGKHYEGKFILHRSFGLKRRS